MSDLEPQKIVFPNRLNKARVLAYNLMKSISDTPAELTPDDMFIVWFSKTLQNWKALVSASFPGAVYIELTYNGDKEETYIDAYRKVEHVVIPD